MSWRKQVIAGVFGGLAWVGVAQAQVQMPGWFGEIDGMYATKDNGSGINSNNVGYSTPGSGDGVSGRLGYRFNSPWDVALGVFYAKFNNGPDIGFQPDNLWSVTGASALNIDVELGYNMDFSWGALRPFFGARFQEVRDEMGYHPDAPLGCCFNNTTGQGFGPRLGFDGSIHLVGPVSLIGGADVALLTGQLNGTGGPEVASGTATRTIYNYGGRIGLDWEFMPLWHVAAGYRIDVSNGSFFTQEGFIAAPSGGGNLVVQGPFAGVRYNFGGTPH